MATPMQADCAIVTALSEELKAVLFHFRHFRPVNTDHGLFYETLSGNGLKVVAATTTGMGQLAAAALAQHVLDVFSPKTVLLVGIAGGLDPKIPLGDVVAAEQIVDYELGKVTAEGFGPRWSVYRTDSGLLNRVRSWTNQNWQQYITAKRPGGKGKPSLHSGVYLSGNKVIADAQTAGALKSVWAKGAAIEMEAAGIAAMLAARPHPPGFMVFKGICDRADSTKDDSWHRYAADAAASCALSFVLEQLQPADVATPNPPAPPVRPKSPDRTVLLDAISAAYDLPELKGLCFALNVDWDEIAGQRKSEKIVELILFLSRRKRLDELIHRVNKERDNLLRAYQP
jgi:nucleoside phosphorylase